MGYSLRFPRQKLNTSIHVLLIQVLLVTGGTGPLDSVELYDPRVGSWVVAKAKLPLPGYALRAININNRVLIFGKFSLFRSVGSLELTLSGHVRSCHVRELFEKCIIQELHNMVQDHDM